MKTSANSVVSNERQLCVLARIYLPDYLPPQDAMALVVISTTPRWLECCRSLFSL